MAGTPGRSGGWNRKSVAEHLTGGTFRSDRHSIDRGNLALLPTAPGRPPTHRDLDEQAIRRLVRGLSRSSRAVGRTLLLEFEGWATADLSVLRLLLETLDRASECRKLIAADGLMLKGTRGVSRPHPMIRPERQAAALAASLFKQLGLGGLK